MPRDFKIAVVGTGFWGRNHLRVLNELGAKIEAVCDVDAGKAEAAAKKYGVKRFYTNLDEMLSREDLDAATICTPSVSHADCAVKTLEAGLHTFVEKPLASTVDECLRIVDAMNSSNRIVMTGFIERFNPAVMKAVELLNAGEIGKIIMLHGRRIGRWPERIGDVGVIKDTAIHDIDLTRFIFKQDPVQVYARGGRQVHRLEDHVQSILTFEDESRVAFIEANWLTPRKKREMEITGSNGVLSIKFLTQEVSLEKADVVVEPIIKQMEPLKLELQHFLDCISKNMKPAADAVEGLKAIAVAEAMLDSMKSGKVVEIDLKSLR